jgi:hypothetical protein
MIVFFYIGLYFLFEIIYFTQKEQTLIGITIDNYKSSYTSLDKLFVIFIFMCMCILIPILCILTFIDWLKE